ncbi:hypothetical protein [Streptomyces antimycoticus]|uniref:hypothetical protein n=1 Tax=Streptomyces antimycoticus TaxID=68175 RepID=UPI00256FADAA|nr:hypothetical protein [Streptomyces antimycoticus]WJD94709.1 hypothetical protein QR300_00970 [Streptomyces antimycoticus]
MSKFLREDDIVRVESNVYSVSGSNTNWGIVKDVDSCTSSTPATPATATSCSPRWRRSG